MPHKSSLFLFFLMLVGLSFEAYATPRTPIAGDEDPRTPPPNARVLRAVGLSEIHAGASTCGNGCRRGGGKLCQSMTESARGAGDSLYPYGVAAWAAALVMITPEGRTAIWRHLDRQGGVYFDGAIERLRLTVDAAHSSIDVARDFVVTEVPKQKWAQGVNACVAATVSGVSGWWHGSGLVLQSASESLAGVRDVASPYMIGCARRTVALGTPEGRQAILKPIVDVESACRLRVKTSADEAYTYATTTIPAQPWIKDGVLVIASDTATGARSCGRGARKFCSGSNKSLGSCMGRFAGGMGSVWGGMSGFIDACLKQRQERFRAFEAGQKVD